MEIYGVLPFPSYLIDSYNAANGTNYSVNLIKDQFTIIGSSTSDDNVYSCVISMKLYVKDVVPDGDEAVSTSDTEVNYDKTIFTSSAVIIKTQNGLDVTDISDFTLVDYETGTSFTMNLTGLSSNTTNTITILNYMGVDPNLSSISDIVNQILDDLNKITLPEFNSGIYELSNGSVITNQYTNSLNQVIDDKQWNGTLPLDVLINVITKNLDLLLEEEKLKGDAYAVHYVTLFNQAMTLCVDLEKYRWSLITENFVKLINAKLQALDTLADYQTKQATVSLTKSQTRVMNAQYKGFAANNRQKVFNTQVEASASAFSAGMTETPPPIFNNAELMNAYTAAKSDMDDL